MSSKALVLILAVAVVSGASGVAWLHQRGEQDAAVAAFEAFYWKVQKGDLSAARALALPGSDAEHALAESRDAVPGAVARGFALDVRPSADGKLDGRAVVRISGRATVTVDPIGQPSAFGVLVPHEVEARLVEDQGTWRVCSFRDEVTSAD